jgi:hypothetical protein
LHPLSHIQSEHWERLEGLDRKADEFRGAKGTGAYVGRRGRMMRAYYRAYQKTWAECVAEAEAAGLGHSMRRWLYRGFWWNTVRQVPSTSAGLIIFELVRRKYGMGGEPVRTISCWGRGVNFCDRELMMVAPRSAARWRIKGWPRAVYCLMSEE